MADSQKKLIILPDNPLCGISTYKDTLNLATGACTRQIKKLVLTGKEAFTKNDGQSTNYLYYANRATYLPGSIGRTPVLCNELPVISSAPQTVIGINTDNTFSVVYFNFGADVMNAQPSGNTVAGLKEYLAAQYAAGTPVTVWYVLSAPTTETIAVPYGLSGTEEGYLNRSGSPTPANPIYPTANNVEIWLHSLRKLTTATDTITTLPADLYADGTNATISLDGNMSQTGTPTPDNPIMPQGTGDLETSGAKAGQYKIPISSANTTTPVYLGEVETTRRVRKYECTGEENWQFYSDSIGTYGAWQFYANNIVNGLASSSAQSNIADYGVTSTTRHMNPYGAYLVTNGTGLAFQMGGAKDTFTNVTAWKSYLAAQYAAGTPVTVWYVLAEPETAVVNEPLMKIGDYADEVSGISIPTITGADTISVDTTLQPSEVTVNYKGWHDAQCKEYDGSQWV